MNRKSKTIAVAFVIAGLAATPLAFAQDNSEPKQPAAPQDMQEMMQGGGMGMMGMMSQMNEMMGTCNKMMQAMMPDMDKPAEEGKQPNKG
jgi:protein CpxP